MKTIHILLFSLAVASCVEFTSKPTSLPRHGAPGQDNVAKPKYNVKSGNYLSSRNLESFILCSKHKKMEFLGEDRLKSACAHRRARTRKTSAADSTVILG